MSVSIKRLVICPNCGDEHTKVLYDWQFIYCVKCKTYFEKHTGKKIDCEKPPKQYWKTDRELGI